MTSKLAAIVAALTVVIDAAARVRVALWPGWVVPLPTLIVAALALLALVLAARLTLALLGGRGVLPYVAVAVTWRVVGR